MESDAEFIERMEKWSEPGSDADRLFALSRRGAAMQWLARKDFDLTDYFDIPVLALERGTGTPAVRTFSSGDDADGYTHFFPLSALGEPDA